MDSQVLQFLQENSVQLKTEVEKILPFLRKEEEEHGIQGVVEYAYGYIDTVHKKVDMASKTTCGSGCSFCCHSDINMSSYEGSYILGIIEYLKIPINTTRLEKQQSKKFHKLKYADKACVMLDKKGNCMIYDHRPIICRLWNSTSNPKHCDGKGGYQKTRTARVIESWAMSLAIFQLDMERGINSKEIFLHKIIEL